ncbi:MAG: arylsulfatase [Actinobacteria bacterium]|nr:MAG: arylsulfatase [Actinomycetota bacterium]
MSDGIVEYEAGSPFPGVIGRTLDESSPAWPMPPRAPEGAPNVVIFVLDDVGYGQLSAFGGLCETPNIDRLAKRGLRYSNFQTTALCSPTRGCLLTGRNHHTLGLSAITELSMGYPAHNAVMGFEHGFLSEMLVERGYNTFAVGKWHLTPPAETTMAGPFNRWPLGRGFERYYGFLGGDTDQWYPDLIHDNHAVMPPSKPTDGYHLNADLADHAIDFIKDAHVNAPEKPFFLPEWIERYRGTFDMGWDEYRRVVFERQVEAGIVPAGTELSERDPDVPAWDSLSEEARHMYARQMETFAGFLSQTDHHFGRVLDFIEHLGELDNTIVVVLSDNGASAEGGVHGTRNETLFFNNVPETLEDNLEVFDEWGGVDTFPHYAWGWTWAGDTPFRRWKRETYRGGITDPCVVFWPRGITAVGEVRDQYVHAIDITPTILDAVGMEPPAALRGVSQSELHGVSFTPTFDDAGVESRHVTQYFEMFGHRSIYHDGWKAVCPWIGPSFAEGQEKGRVFGLSNITPEVLDDLDANDWELYDLSTDRAECHNVADRHAEKLREMIQRWWIEAGRYGALPVAAVDLNRLFSRRPSIGRARKRFVYYPGGSPVPFAAAPSVYNRPFAITAAVAGYDGSEGVLLAHGGRHGGHALYVQHGRLHYVHNYLSLQRFKVSSVEAVPAGDVTLRYEFEPTGALDILNGRGTPGQGRLLFGDHLVGVIELPYTVPGMFGVAGLSCGYDACDSVNPEDYAAPFPFSGDLASVTLDLSGELTVVPEVELQRLMTQQ